MKLYWQYRVSDDSFSLPPIHPGFEDALDELTFGVNLPLMSLQEYSGVTLDALKKAPKSIS